MINEPLHLIGHVHVAPDADQLYDDLAGAVMSAALNAMSDRGEFHIALSGGSTPEPFYERLVLDPRFRAIPWENTHVWIVDERRVPPDDEKCNYKMISETLLDHVPMKGRQRHPMPVLRDDVAELYEAELREFVDVNAMVPRIDFILLGMGGDAHTASLFPKSPALNETEKLIAINEGPAVTPPDRVTMTYRLINAARKIGVLLTGSGKADALRQVSEQLRIIGPDISNFPITGVNPALSGGEADDLVWYLDQAAAVGSNKPRP